VLLSLLITWDPCLNLIGPLPSAICLQCHWILVCRSTRCFCHCWLLEILVWILLVPFLRRFVCSAIGLIWGAIGLVCAFCLPLELPLSFVGRFDLNWFIKVPTCSASNRLSVHFESTWRSFHGFSSIARNWIVVHFDWTSGESVLLLSLFVKFLRIVASLDVPSFLYLVPCISVRDIEALSFGNLFCWCRVNFRGNVQDLILGIF